MPFGAPPSPTMGQVWPTVNPRWMFDGTNWVSIAGQLVTESVDPLVTTDQFLILRAGEAKLVTASVVADFAGGGSPDTVPAALTAGQWEAAATANPGEISFNILTLPADGGSPITALEYRVGTGSAIAFTGTGTGVRVVTAGLTAGVAADLQVRAVNAVGAGAWSDTKNRTPAASGGGGGTLIVSQGTGADIVGGESATYRSSGGTNNGYWEPGVNSGRMLWRPGSNFNTTNIPGTITGAVLRIYMVEQFGASTVTAYNNLRAWVAGAGTPSWAEYAPSTAWETAGGSGAADRSATSIGTEAAPGTNGVWVEIELDAASVESWRQAGGVGACGVQLVGSDQYSTFYTDTNTDDLTLRPQLVVTYS